MEAERLNYSTHAIDALLRQVPPISILAPTTAAITRKIAADLKVGVKFLLPDEGVIFAGKRKPGSVPDIDLFHLPFPITIVEFHMQTPDSESEHRSGVQIISALKRLAIAYDMSVPEVRAGWAPLSAIKNVPTDGVLIWPVNDVSGASQEEVAATGGWSLNWCGAHIPANSVATLRDVDSLPPDLKEEVQKNNPGVTRTGYFNYNAIVCGEVGRAVSNDFIDRGVYDAMITRDIIHEVNAVLDLGVALACRNVRKEVVAAPDKLNKKRERSGKTPFFDYHILTVDVPGRTGGGAGIGTPTGRSSPRGHLRRGHIRRLDTGPIWINSTVVNPGHDFLGKDYKVRG